MSEAFESPHDVCGNCKAAYETVWYAPSYLWNQFIRQPDGSEKPCEMLCPTCFNRIVEGAGVSLVWTCHPVADQDECPEVELALKRLREIQHEFGLRVTDSVQWDRLEGAEFMVINAALLWGRRQALSAEPANKPTCSTCVHLVVPPEKALASPYCQNRVHGGAPIDIQSPETQSCIGHEGDKE